MSAIITLATITLLAIGLAFLTIAFLGHLKRRNDEQTLQFKRAELRQNLKGYY